MANPMQPVSGAPVQSQLPPPMQPPQQSAAQAGPAATPQEIENFSMWARQNNIQVPPGADVAGFITALKNEEPDAIEGAKNLKEAGFPQRWATKAAPIPGNPTPNPTPNPMAGPSMGANTMPPSMGAAPKMGM